MVLVAVDESVIFSVHVPYVSEKLVGVIASVAGALNVPEVGPVSVPSDGTMFTIVVALLPLQVFKL